MSDIQLFSFQSKTVRVFIVDGVPFFVAQDVGAILEYSDIRRMLDLVDEDDKLIVNPNDYCDEIEKKTLYRNTFKLSVVNEQGIRALLYSNKSKATDLAKHLGVSVYIPTKEARYIRIIKNTFKQYSSIEQFYISGYRIDLYFPELRLSIECDENGHLKYEKDDARQDQITLTLGCKWVRFNPDSRNFCIGNVIHDIYKTIISD